MLQPMKSCRSMLTSNNDQSNNDHTVCDVALFGNPLTKVNVGSRKRERATPLCVQSIGRAEMSGANTTIFFKSPGYNSIVLYTVRHRMCPISRISM